MAKPTQKNEFTLLPLKKEDLREMAELQAVAQKGSVFLENWRGSASDERVVSFIYQWHEKRFDVPNFIGHKVVDRSGKMVAWGGVNKPYDLSPEEKKVLAVLPQVEGWNHDITIGSRGLVFPLTEGHGYDPKKHFHRMTTMVHPSHQRLGLGRLMVRAANELADKAGAPTYVRALPNATAMLQKEGFRVLETKDIDWNKLGGTWKEKIERVAGLKREVGGVEKKKVIREGWGETAGE